MIAVVHLVWAPLGMGPLQAFLRSYREHAAGEAHELIIALNGVGADGVPAEGRAASAGEIGEALAETPHRLVVLTAPQLDLAAYGHVVRELEHRRVCFLNSYSEILGDSWLARLARPLGDPAVGLVGATGSWESQAEWIRGRARYWGHQLARLPLDRRRYPRFPNPHIRTTGFMLDRELASEMGLERVREKRDAYLLESGHRSITRLVQERGLRAVVVGRDGIAHDVDRWPASNTYRSGSQQNLLLSDNRTREWQAAAPRVQRRLTRDAWGPRQGFESMSG